MVKKHHKKKQGGCSATFTMNKQTHEHMRNFTKEMVEYGGNLMFDMKTRTLNAGDTDTGKYNGISMERGVVDWHSHPARCKNDNMCALGLPSPADLANILVGALYGSSAHLVYAKEGTYLIQVSADLIRQLKKDDRKHTMLSSALDQIDKHFEALHKHFLVSHITYREYMKLWMNEISDYGFNVKLFEKNTLPSIHIVFDCHFLKRKHPFIPRIDVPGGIGKHV